MYIYKKFQFSGKSNVLHEKQAISELPFIVKLNVSLVYVDKSNIHVEKNILRYFWNIIDLISKMKKWLLGGLFS